LRDRDTEIPPDEQLYRSIEADWVDGDKVLPFAIDGEGTSCSRQSYVEPQQALYAAVASRPEENGIAYTTAKKLPLNFRASNHVCYDVFAYDCPTLENEAHCEIRWRRYSDRPTEEHFKRVRGAAKDELKAAIADQMTILIQPTPLVREG
jgi:hypothetical protein